MHHVCQSFTAVEYDICVIQKRMYTIQQNENMYRIITFNDKTNTIILYKYAIK